LGYAALPKLRRCSVDTRNHHHIDRSYVNDMCTVGIDITDANLLELAPQAETNWCWAACLQAAARLANHPIGQKTIVDSIFSEPANLPASLSQIQSIRAGDKVWKDDRGACFSIDMNTIFDVSDIDERTLRQKFPQLFRSSNSSYFDEIRPMIFEDLVDGYPVIFSLQGLPSKPNHTVLLLEVILNAKTDKGILNQYKVFDPYPKSLSENIMRDCIVFAA
jgi:hypothetical protein